MITITMYYNTQNKKSQAKNEGAGIFIAGSGGDQLAGGNGLAPSFVAPSRVPVGVPVQGGVPHHGGEGEIPFSPKNSSVNVAPGEGVVFDDGLKGNLLYLTHRKLDDGFYNFFSDETLREIGRMGKCGSFMVHSHSKKVGDKEMFCGARVGVEQSCKSRWCLKCNAKWRSVVKDRLYKVVSKMKWPSHLVITVKNDVDLDGMIEKLLRSLNLLYRRKDKKAKKVYVYEYEKDENGKRKYRKDKRGRKIYIYARDEKGRRKHVYVRRKGGKKVKSKQYPLLMRGIRGGVVCVGLTYSEEEGWHYHLHIIIDCRWLKIERVREAWFDITGDSRNIDIKRVYDVGKIVNEVVSGTYGDIEKLVKVFCDDLFLFDQAVRAFRGRKWVWGFGNVSTADLREEKLRTFCPKCGAEYKSNEWQRVTMSREEYLKRKENKDGFGCEIYQGFVYMNWDGEVVRGPPDCNKNAFG